MINAIPTEYKGLRFRSRTEAKWAAFFDALKIPWQYKPLDLAGYVPDFVIHDRLLVEVKPEFNRAELHRHAAKIVASGWEHDFAIASGTPRICSAYDESFVCGNYYEKADRGRAAGTLIAGRCRACKAGRLGAPWRCPACGGGIDADRGMPYLWATACNKTAWMPYARAGSDREAVV